MRAAQLAVAVVAVALLILAGLNFADYSNLRRPPAVITRTPQAQNLALCPGDLLHYTYGLRPDHVPVVPRIARTVWNVVQKETAVPMRLGDEEVRIWLAHDEITNREAYRVPELPAGEYQLRVATVAEGSRPVVFQVPFAIKKGCK